MVAVGGPAKAMSLGGVVEEDVVVEFGVEEDGKDANIVCIVKASRPLIGSINKYLARKLGSQTIVEGLVNSLGEIVLCKRGVVGLRLGPDRPNGRDALHLVGQAGVHLVAFLQKKVMLRLHRDHAVVGEDDQVGSMILLQLDQSLVQAAKGVVEFAHLGQCFLVERAVLVRHAVGLRKVNKQTIGRRLALVDAAEPGEGDIDLLVELDVRLVPLQEGDPSAGRAIGAVAVGDFAARPLHRAAGALRVVQLVGDVDGHRKVELIPPVGGAVADVEVFADHWIPDFVVGQAVVRLKQPGDNRLVVGKGFRGKLRQHMAAGGKRLQPMQVRCVRLVDVIGPEAIHRDHDQVERPIGGVGGAGHHPKIGDHQA